MRKTTRTARAANRQQEAAHALFDWTYAAVRSYLVRAIPTQT